MAYVNEADAGFRFTALTHGAAAILGRIRAAVNKIIGREVIQADGNNFPVSRPVDNIDARVVAGYLDFSGSIAESVASANLTLSLTEADGGSGSLVVGKMLGSSVDTTMARRMGGFLAEQTFELEGTLTYTPTI